MCVTFSRLNWHTAAARLFLHPDILDLDGAELRAKLERRRLGAGLGRPNRLTVDPVLDFVAGNDDLERVPFTFLDVLVFLVARNDVELCAAQEQVVIAFRTGLEV